MKRAFLLGTGLLLGTALFALDLSFTGGAGNLFFNAASTEPLDSGEFWGNNYPLGRISVADEIHNGIRFDIAFERDPLLRNLISCGVGLEAGNLTFSVGPLFGVFNTRENPIKPGFIADIALHFPGILFVNLNAGATFGSFRSEGDYAAETASIGLGFWLPNMVSSLTMTSKKFSLIRTGDLHTEDELLRFRFRNELHSKSFPYVIYIDMGYQNLTRSYEAPAVNGTDEFRSIFLGFEAALTVRPLFTLLFGAELPVYAWGKNPLSRGDTAWFYRAFAGFLWTFEKKA